MFYKRFNIQHTTVSNAKYNTIELSYGTTATWSKHCLLTVKTQICYQVIKLNVWSYVGKIAQFLREKIAQPSLIRQVASGTIRID